MEYGCIPASGNTLLTYRTSGNGGVGYGTYGNNGDRLHPNLWKYTPTYGTHGNAGRRLLVADHVRRYQRTGERNAICL